ncbi:LamG-like jellyroll fold domain-containing protein [Halorubellus sp. PRR65]|uniref:LamG-like jellyroll fold domain-containing protein n=1 Tax=Halorubellus sp. PRR65 TaxID=3098148 RepID=UPI002B25F989|nr:LamG-like jellyroll fold domain-containing protein [Halorubellus sp. PRR65]
MEESVFEVVKRRADVLDLLRDGPFDKRVLVERVGSSRSTVDRATRELASKGLIRRVNGEFETTVTGVLALDVVQECERSATALERAAAALEPLWKESPLSVDFLRGADRALVGDVAGFDVRAGVRAAFERASSVRAVVPDVSSVEHLEVLYAQAVEGDTTVELVCSEALFDALAASYSGWLHGIVVDGGATVGTAAVPEFALFVSDLGTHRVAQLLVYDDGRPHAVLRNETDAALAWADGCVEACTARATDRTADVRDLPESSSFAGVDGSGPVLGDRAAAATTPADLDGGEPVSESLLGAGYAVDGERLRTPAFGATGAATVACWLRPTGSLSTWQVVVKWDELSLALRHRRFFGTLYDRDDERRRAEAGLPVAELTVDAWQHVAYVADGETGTLYLDGEVVAETVDAYPVALDDIGAAIGYHYVDRDQGVHTPDFEGQLADVRFYDAALDAGDVERIYRTTAPSRGHAAR